MSCDIHTHTPARKNYTNLQLYYLLYKCVQQTVLGLGMGVNVTAHLLLSVLGSGNCPPPLDAIICLHPYALCPLSVTTRNPSIYLHGALPLVSRGAIER